MTLKENKSVAKYINWFYYLNHPQFTRFPVLLNMVFSVPPNQCYLGTTVTLLHVRKLSKEVVSFLSSYVWLLHPDEINAQANSRAHLQFVL